MSSQVIEIAELFAGVGGFRLGLEGYHNPSEPDMELPAAGPFKTVWANQWEPPGTDARQFAARCYRSRFGEDAVVNEDIHVVLDKYERGEIDIPDVDMVVGGFPCQDYSVAKPLSQAGGIEGKKGVLWWDIYRFLQLKMKAKKKPRYVLLENVDRLLKSPASQRGRDFAIILSCFNKLGYSVEWRVVNSAEYGFSQRRKRTYILARLTEEKWDIDEQLSKGLMAQAFPIEALDPHAIGHISIPEDPYLATKEFNKGGKVSPFMEAGAMQSGQVATCKVVESYDGPRSTLGDVLVDGEDVPEEFYIDPKTLEKWVYLKGAKNETRVNKKGGFTYQYSEGAMAFPDALDRPSRTILTGEGGRGASRFKHAIKTESGRYRRLVPDELDQLQGFPRGWTNTGMTDGQRAFCMGNALVVGVPHAIGKVLAEHEGFEAECYTGPTNPERRDSTMSDVLFIEYPKCSTCRRAKAWLDEHGVSYADRHIVEDNPTADELAAWQARSGLPVRRFFNTSGRLYRERNVKALLDAGMSDDEAFALLAEDGMLVKRPIVVGEDFVLVGFREAEWEAALL